MARMVSLGIIALLIAALGAMFYQLIAPFLMPLFLAGLTALLAQPVFRYFMSRCRQKRSLAAACSTATIMGAVLLPLLVAMILGVLELFVLATGTTDRVQTAMRWAQGNLQHPQQVAISEDEAEPKHGRHRNQADPLKPIVDRCVAWTEAKLGLQPSWIEIDVLHSVSEEHLDAMAAHPEDLREVRAHWFREQLLHLQGLLKGVAFQTIGVIGRVLGQAPSILAACGALLIGLAAYAIALFYFFADGPDLILATQTLIPIERQHQQELMQRFADSVRALVLATFLAAVGQGVATAVGMKLIGLGPFFLLLIAATLSALIPMAGTWLVWFPYVCWLMWEGHWGYGLFLTIYGIGFVGMLDNVIRTYILQNSTKLHPLLAVVSVFGGLEVMGLWGVFIGPIVACCLHALLEIFNQEIRILSRDPLPISPEPTAASVAVPAPMPVPVSPAVAATLAAESKGAST